MAAEKNFALLKKCCFSIDTELMEALLIKRFQIFFNIKLDYSHSEQLLLLVFH